MICLNEDDIILFVVIVCSTFIISILCICVAAYRRKHMNRARRILTTERSLLHSPLGVRPTEPPPLPPITSRSDICQSFNYTLSVAQ